MKIDCLNKRFKFCNYHCNQSESNVKILNNMKLE